MENKVLKEKFIDERTGIEYRVVGDYYIPNIKIPKARRTGYIGKYGRLKLNYMKKYKIPEYTEMLLSNELKANNQMEWVQKMNNIKHRAEEIILNEIIYL